MDKMKAELRKLLQNAKDNYDKGLDYWRQYEIGKKIIESYALPSKKYERAIADFTKDLEKVFKIIENTPDDDALCNV